MIDSGPYQRFRRAVESLDRGEPLEDAMAGLRPQMWRMLLPGPARAVTKSALRQLFNDLTPPEADKLIRETEAELRELERKT